MKSILCPLPVNTAKAVEHILKKGLEIYKVSHIKSFFAASISGPAAYPDILQRFVATLHSKQMKTIVNFFILTSGS